MNDIVALQDGPDTVDSAARPAADSIFVSGALIESTQQKSVCLDVCIVVPSANSFGLLPCG